MLSVTHFPLNCSCFPLTVASLGLIGTEHGGLFKNMESFEMVSTFLANK